MKTNIKKILKIIIFFAFSVLFVFNHTNPARAEYKAPKPYNFVNDFANLISDNNETKLNSLLKEVSTKTRAQIAVVTLSSLDGYPIEDVGLSIGRQWGVGQKDKNNGVVILVAPNERKMRIEVGYGLEGAIPDSKAGRIRDELMIPEFKKGNYETGIIYATEKIANLVAQEYGVKITGEYNLPQPPEQNSDFEQFILFVLLFIIISGLFNKRTRNSSIFPFWIGYGLGSLGGRSSNDFSGFGGFGGGGFGGGGASGGW